MEFKEKEVIKLLKELPYKQLLALPGFKETIEWHYEDRLKELSEKSERTYKPIVVCDSSTLKVAIYDVFEEWESEDIENFLVGKGHHLSNCNWAEFDGEVDDTRKEYEFE